MDFEELLIDFCPQNVVHYYGRSGRPHIFTVTFSHDSNSMEEQVAVGRMWNLHRILIRFVPHLFFVIASRQFGARHHASHCFLQDWGR